MKTISYCLVLAGLMWVVGCVSPKSSQLNKPVVLAQSADVFAAASPTRSIFDDVEIAAASQPATQPTANVEYDSSLQMLDKQLAFDIAEASMIFKSTRPLRLVMVNGELVLEGMEDFQSRQESFLQLIDICFSREDHLTGMNKAQIEQIFGTGIPDPSGASQGNDRYIWDAGRDLMVVEFHGNRAVFVACVIGN